MSHSFRSKFYIKNSNWKIHRLAVSHACIWTSGTAGKKTLQKRHHRKMLLLLSSDNYHKAYCWHYYYRVNSLENYLVQYLATANNCFRLTKVSKMKWQNLWIKSMCQNEGHKENIADGQYVSMIEKWKCYAKSDYCMGTSVTHSIFF